MPRYTIPKDSSGRFPKKHTAGIDPELVGVRAFDHPVVKRYHEWLLSEWNPSSRVILLTPCSNVKPYTKSPTSRKVRGLLRRLGLWDGSADRPRGVDWLYLSDLLILVPYERAEEYPACCYELHPEDLVRSPRHYKLVVDTLARLIEEKLAGHTVVTFLPRAHLRMWSDALEKAGRKPSVHTVRYTLFSTRELEETLRRTLGLGGSAQQETLDAWVRG